MNTLAVSDNRRNSSIELLRIIAMIMILFHHFAVHGYFSWDNNLLTIPQIWYNFIIMGGGIGVNLFVLISGFFLIDNTDTVLNFKRILKLWWQLFSYSVLIYVIFCSLGINFFEIKPFIISLFPISFSSWWFATTYFVLYLLHPFLNKLLHCLDKKSFLTLIILLTILYSVVPTFLTVKMPGDSLLWFVTLYSISSYIKKYCVYQKYSSITYLVAWFMLSLMTYFSSIIISLLSIKKSFFTQYITYFYGEEKITTLLISLSLFLFFTSMKVSYSKLINLLSSTTFGIYLIHDSNIIKPFLWNSLFKNAQYQDSILLIPYSIIVVVIIFIFCTFIDLLRQEIIEKPFLILLNKLSFLTIMRSKRGHE